MITLYEQNDKCCACAACANICPAKAITMSLDADGFMYPKINYNLCIQCGACKKVCAFQNVSIVDNVPIATYAAINKEQSVLQESASGGVFAALAALIFERNGVVFGCAYNGEMEPEHICIDNFADIKKLQGSKYVQSNINTTYAEAQKYLKESRWVLFVGTPCQIAGLKSYLGKDYNNLITADLICHGVPSATFFKGYIKHLEDVLKGKVIDFKFRDKSKGWGYIGKVLYRKNESVISRCVPAFTSYYCSYFLNGDINRESCYQCKYACQRRQGDFTIGDYWGIEKEHPQIEAKNGVSVLLVNTEKGIGLINNLTEYLDLTKSDFKKAQRHNGQLNKPIAKSSKREQIFKVWREGGYKAVAYEYHKANKLKSIVRKSKMMIPQSVKRFIKKLLNRW